MNQIGIERVREIFRVDQRTLAGRERVLDYVQSFAILIVDAFFEAYLDENDRFRRHVSAEESARLKRLMRDTLVSLFADPFDQELLDGLARVGATHGPLRPDPLDVARGFEILQGVVIDLAAVNEHIRTDLAVILKFFKIAEHVMTAAVRPVAPEAAPGGSREIVMMEVFDKLFRLHSRHRYGMRRAGEVRDASDPAARAAEFAAEMPATAADCPLSGILDEFARLDLPLASLDIDLTAIDARHHDFHLRLKDFLDAAWAEAPAAETLAAWTGLEDASRELMRQIDKPLQDITVVSFLAVNAGFRFLQTVSRRFYESDALLRDPREIAAELERALPDFVDDTLGWCVSDLVVASAEPPAGAYQIVKRIELEGMGLHVGVTLKELPNRRFLEELVTALLEVVRVQLLNIEREAKLVEFADAAERANQAKDVFLANMSHELRTPLNAIIGFSQLLMAREEIPPELAPYVEKIKISGDNLLTLVNTILDFAKLEAGKLSFNPVQALVGDTIHEVMLIVEPLARAKRIELGASSLISLSLHFDPQLVKQVLINLLTNAIKFTPEGGRVRLEIEYLESRSGYEFRVCDTGVGISHADVKKLFLPFQQIDNGLQKQAHGTGLGLTIAKKIVEELHGGAMHVESVEGEGSTFSFTLPIRSSEIFVRRVREAGEDAPRLLLVEDDETYVDLLVASLAPKYELTVTNSVKRAVELLAEEDYYYLVLDFFLVDGISSEIVRHLAETGVDTPVIIISAEDDSRIVGNIMHSENIEGIFNKSDIERICGLLGNLTESVDLT